MVTILRMCTEDDKQTCWSIRVRLWKYITSIGHVTRDQREAYKSPRIVVWDMRMSISLLITSSFNTDCQKNNTKW